MELWQSPQRSLAWASALVWPENGGLEIAYRWWGSEGDAPPADWVASCYEHGAGMLEPLASLACAAWGVPRSGLLVASPEWLGRRDGQKECFEVVVRWDVVCPSGSPWSSLGLLVWFVDSSADWPTTLAPRRFDLCVTPWVSRAPKAPMSTTVAMTGSVVSRHRSKL